MDCSRLPRNAVTWTYDLLRSFDETPECGWPLDRFRRDGLCRTWSLKLLIRRVRFGNDALFVRCGEHSALSERVSERFNGRPGGRAASRTRNSHDHFSSEDETYRRNKTRRRSCGSVTMSSVRLHHKLALGDDLSLPIQRRPPSLPSSVLIICSRHSPPYMLSQ